MSTRKNPGAGTTRVLALGAGILIFVGGCSTVGSVTPGNERQDQAWATEVVQKIAGGKWYANFVRDHHRRPVVSILPFHTNNGGVRSSDLNRNRLRMAVIGSGSFVVVAGGPMRKVAHGERKFLMGHASDDSIKEPRQVLGEDLVMSGRYMGRKALDVTAMSLADNRILLARAIRLTGQAYPGGGEEKALTKGYPVAIENLLDNPVDLWVNPPFIPVILGYDNLTTIPSGAAPDKKLFKRQKVKVQMVSGSNPPLSVCIRFENGSMMNSCRVWGIDGNDAKDMNIVISGADQYGFPYLQFKKEESP